VDQFPSVKPAFFGRPAKRFAKVADELFPVKQKMVCCRGLLLGMMGWE
jgi:hypothetical protein